MAVTWLPIVTIPKAGVTITYTEDDALLWQEKLAETALECTLSKPLEAEITLQLEDEGVVISGTFTAQITLPCAFCLEPATLDIGHIFYDIIHTQEEYLIAEGKYVQETKKGIEIDVAEVVFEEFLIDASATPMCKERCLGLCPLCGINKNLQQCSCDVHGKDPRLEKLRALVLEKKT